MKQSMIIALVGGLLVMTGCTTPNNFSIDETGNIASATDTRSIATMDAGGNIRAGYNGVAPAITMMDSNGAWDTSPGPASVLTFDMGGSRVMSKSPKDTIIRGLKITPNPKAGQPSFEAESIETNISNPLKVHAQMFAAGVAATQGMSKAEAEARLGAMQIAGDITADITDVLIKALYPGE